jgi:segregation and condensation protein B
MPAAETDQNQDSAIDAGRPEVHPVPDWARDADPIDLAPALEAICFALNRPLTLSEAAAILGRSTAAAAEAAEVVATELRRRGLMLQRHQEEIQLVTRPEVAWAVQRALNPERQGRLSRAALETLAIVAYRQPVTRGAIEGIRGVNCEAVLDSLERRELITEVGRQDSPGQPRLFGTTLRFLQVVGLERIEQLPPLPEGAVPALSAATLGLKSDTENDLGGAGSPAATTHTG